MVVFFLVVEIIIHTKHFISKSHVYCYMNLGWKVFISTAKNPEQCDFSVKDFIVPLHFVLEQIIIMTLPRPYN